jgi:transcriptional regulator with XRE-family HTH domain
MNLAERDRERDALRKLIGTRNKAELARKIGIGTPPVVSQHLSGRRPISLEQGVAYAAEFGITLDALSPRLAALARQAAALIAGGEAAGKAAIPTLPAALEVLGMELAKDMPDDVRQDLADALAKLAHRKGLHRHQEDVIRLLSAPAQKHQA